MLRAILCPPRPRWPASFRPTAQREIRRAAKAQMSHLGSGRLEPREDSLQPRRHKVDESAHLDRQKPVGRVHEMDGQRYRLEVTRRHNSSIAAAGLS